MTRSAAHITTDLARVLYARVEQLGNEKSPEMGNRAC